MDGTPLSDPPSPSFSGSEAESGEFEDHCSKRRSKCDGAGPNSPPCSRCVKVGLDCIYTRKVKKRGPPKGSVQSSKRIKSEPGYSAGTPVPLPPKPAAQRSRAAQVASAASIPPIEVTYNYAHDYSEGPSSASAYVLPETGYGGLAPMGGPSGTPLSGPPSPYYPQPDYRASLSPSLPPFQTQWPSQGSSASPSYDQAPSPLPFPQPSVGGPASSEFFPRYDIPAPFGTMRSLGLFAKNDAIPAGVVPAAAPVAPVAPTQAMPPVPGNAHLASVETRTSNGTSKRKSAPPGNAAVATAAVNVERTDSVTEFTALQGSTVIPIPKHQPGLFDDLPPMPPQECLNELVTLYFDYVHHYQPFLHRHTVLRAFSSLPALLQLSIYAAAASFSKDSRIVAMNLYNRAKAQYKMEMDRPSHFQTTQSMLLIIHAVVRTGAGSQAVFWAGQILQMVRHLHLFADPDLPSRRSVPRGFVSFQDLDNMTWIEKESERRTFWAALMVDKLSATAINSFCSIKEDDIFVSLPCHDLIWEADLPAQVDVDPTGIPISVLLNEDPEPPVAPAATMSSHGGLDLNNESLMRYTSGVSQPSGPFAHTARQYVLYGKLLDHRVKCRNRNMSHLADPELSVAIHGWRSQLPSWVLELDEKGIPGTPKLGEDVRWGYSALIMHHYMMSLLFGPGEFRDWVGEKFFSEEAGLLWVTSSMMLKCIDGMKRVSRMMSVVRSRNEDPDILDLGGPFLPYCFFQLGMVGLVALRALSLGIISLDLTGDQIKAVIEVFIWALQKHGKTNRTGHRLAIHLAKLLSDVCEFNGQFPAVDMVERMQQRKIEFLDDMARTNPYRAAYSDELDERARVAGSKASTTASATVSEPVAQGQPSLDLSGLTAPPAKETPGSDTSQTMQAVLNLSLAGVKAAAKSPEGGDIGDVNLVYLQYLRMQGGGTDAGLDRLMNATAGGPVSKAAFVNARSY